MDENRFRQILRVNLLHHLLSLIANYEVFTKRNSKQFSIALQLVIVLFKLGTSGESASVAKITNRIFRCFFFKHIAPKYVLTKLYRTL